MSAQKKDTRFINIIKNLSDTNSKTVLTAINQLRKHGKAEAIPHLIDLYKNSNNQEIKEQLTQFFFDLKDQSATQPIIEAIQEEKEFNNKAFLISILWQSGLDPNDHLSFLVGQAIKGDYMVCFEVLTVIESLENTYPEEEIADIEYDINEAIEIELTEKKDLLISLKTIIQSLTMEF